MALYYYISFNNTYEDLFVEFLLFIYLRCSLHICVTVEDLVTFKLQKDVFLIIFKITYTNSHKNNLCSDVDYL